MLFRSLTKDTHQTVVRLAPPLVIDRAQIDFALAALDRVLRSLQASAKRATEVATV